MPPAVLRESQMFSNKSVKRRGNSSAEIEEPKIFPKKGLEENFLANPNTHFPSLNSDF